MDVFDVWGRGFGAADGRDGGEVEAVDAGGGRVGQAEGVGDGAGAAADVEEAVRGGEGGMDDAVVH